MEIKSNIEKLFGNLPNLELPILKDTNDKGKIVYIIRTGIGSDRSDKATLTVKENDKEVMYITDNIEIVEWSKSSVENAMIGIKPFPSWAEIGIINGRGFVELLNDDKSYIKK